MTGPTQPDEGIEPEITPLNLYSGEPQHNTFPYLTQMFPTTTMEPAIESHQFADGESVSLPTTFESAGETRDTSTFLNQSDTAAFLILQDGAVRFEDYWLTGGRDVQWISWSVAKSFVSALVGIAMDEGHIASIDDIVSDYVPELKGSGYEGVSLRAVLEMSSGVSWNEDYSDPGSDINRFGAAIAGGGSLLEFVSGMAGECAPRTQCQYNSADTQVLGHMLIAATGRTIADYMQEKLYTPLGMESRGYWLLDRDGVEMTFGGLNLTARDYAKLGELFRLGGSWNGQQLVPADWVTASTTSDADHLAYGKVTVGGHVFPFSYGYQWWIPRGDRDEFSAVGVYNQFIYVDPSRNATVVKLSANRRYGLSADDADNRDNETIDFIRAALSSLD